MKEGILLLFSCSSDMMKGGWQIQWIVTAICPTFKTFDRTGKLHANGDSENQSVGQLTIRGENGVTSVLWDADGIVRQTHVSLDELRPNG